MATINFKCKCPCIFCRGEGPIHQWTCPNCKSNMLLEDTGRIICPNCGKNTIYIWKATFPCGNHDEKFHEISYQGLLVTISSIGSSYNPPIGFLGKLSEQCLEHSKDFLQE